MTNIRDVLKTRVVEILCGLVMVVVGVWLTSTASLPDNGGSDTGRLIGGGLLTTLGGVLLSWIAAVALSHKEAVKQLNEQFDAVSRSLGQAATRVTRAVEQCQAGQMDTSTGLALIAQATTMIYGQIDQIQRLTGTRLDSEELTLTLTELDKLAAKLDRQPSASTSDIREDVVRILAKVRRSSESVATVDVECPYCDTKTAAPLGTESGATTRVQCRSCLRQFNAHRAGSGTFFARPLAFGDIPRPIPSRPATAAGGARPYKPQDAQPPTEPSDVACCQCGFILRIKPSTDDVPRLMLCTECFTANFVTPQSLQVTMGEKFTLTTGTIIGRSGSQPYVPCPTCQKPFRCILKNSRGRFGFCQDHRQAMEVRNADFEEWRTMSRGA